MSAMRGQLEADADGVAIVIVQNVGDGHVIELSVAPQRGAGGKVFLGELFHALPPSAAQLDRRVMAEATRCRPCSW